MDTISKQKKIFNSLEDLTTHKVKLKQEIEAQRIRISNSCKEITSPISMIISIFSTIHKGINLINGLQTGLKLVSYIKNLLRKK